MKPTVILAFAACFTLALSSASAQEITSSSDKDRYTLSEVDGGFVKIDRKLGTVSLCTITSGNMVCRLGADERGAYEETMDQLRAEIEALDARLAKLESAEVTESEEETSSVLPPKPEQNEQAEEDTELPEEFDTAMEIAQEAMRRFFSVIQEMKKEYEEKAAEPKT